MGVKEAGAVTVALLTLASAGAEARRFGEGSGFWDMNSRQDRWRLWTHQKAAFFSLLVPIDRLVKNVFV
jgi:hypothetical protein